MNTLLISDIRDFWEIIQLLCVHLGQSPTVQVLLPFEIP